MIDAIRKTILLVEDEAVIALDERRILKDLGYRVKLAHSGEDAVAVFLGDPSIDLVLMDINLGSGIDGTEAARRMLEARDAPVVFLSSHTEVEIVEKTERITSYGYILKNSSPTVLQASVKMAFKLFEANRKTLASNRRLEATLAALPDLFFELAQDGRYVDVHCADQSLLWMPEGELLGERVPDVLPPEAAAVVMSAIGEAEERGVSKGGRYQLLVPAGLRWFEVSACRMANPGGEARYVLICRDVTERVRDDEALRASKRYAESLLNVSAEILMSTDLDGRVVMLNDSGHRLLGYEPGDLVGMSWADTCLEGETRAEVAGFLEGLLKSPVETLVPHENHVRLKNGELRSVLWHNTVLRDEAGRITGILSSGEDVSEYKSLEARYRTVVETSPDVITVTDLRGRILMVSPKAAAVFGYSSVEGHLGRPVTDFMVPEDRERAAANLGRMARGELLGSEEYRGLRGDGGVFDIEINGEFIRDEDGFPLQILFIVRDISARKGLVSRISALLAEKDTILKEVHHRIKNNFGVIRSLLELEAQSAADERAAQAFKTTERRVRSMALLYQKLYESASFLEASAAEYLSSLAEDVVSNVPNRAGIRLGLDIDDVVLDAKRLQTLGIIVSEALTNSLKHAFAGRDGGAVSVALRSSGGAVELVAADDGVGLPEGAETGGAGFGLSLISMLTEQLGGTLAIERKGGTRFTVILPETRRP